MDENPSKAAQEYTKRTWRELITPWVRHRLIALFVLSIGFIVGTRTAYSIGGFDAYQWFSVVWLIGILVVTIILGMSDDNSDEAAYATTTHEKSSETDARPRRRMNSRELGESNPWAGFLATLFILFAFFVLLGRLDVDAPSARDRVILLVTLFAFHLPALLRSGKIYRTLRRRRAEEVFVCRPRTRHVCYWLQAYLPLGFVLLISYRRLWTYPDVGASNSVHWGLSILVGLLAGVAFQTVTHFLRRRNDPLGIPKSHDIYVLRCHLARGHTARVLSNLNTALLGPAFEELVYRGFFVYFLGETSEVRG